MNIKSILIFILFLTGCTRFELNYIDSSWKKSSFVFPKDELSCEGKQLIQYNKKYDVYVGLILCGTEDKFRAYMSKDKSGPYLPITDTGGHGQDHCELVNANFKLPNSDNIKSGGCSTCSTSKSLPLEHVKTWSRSRLGKPFKLVKSGTWAYQTARLNCGVTFSECSIFTNACKSIIN